MSMATIRAPRVFRARMAWVITLTWVATALVPQMTMQSLSAISSGFGPCSLPAPARYPGQAVPVQMVSYCRE